MQCPTLAGEILATATSSPETQGRILDLQRQMLVSQGATAEPASVEEGFQLQFARRANAELDAAGWAPRS
jgi:hypothetical protein